MHCATTKITSNLTSCSMLNNLLLKEMAHLPIRIYRLLMKLLATSEVNICQDLLQRLQVPVDDLSGVQIEHAHGNLPSPAQDLRGRNLHVQSDVVVQRAPRTVLHDDAVARWMCAHAPGNQPQIHTVHLKHWLLAIYK